VTNTPVSIEIRTGDEPAAIEVAGGEIETRVGLPATPDLVLDGEPSVVLGVLTGLLSVGEARRRGLRTSGDVKILNRLVHNDRRSWERAPGGYFGAIA
jgi:hypothetical protein